MRTRKPLEFGDEVLYQAVAALILLCATFVEILKLPHLKGRFISMSLYLTVKESDKDQSSAMHFSRLEFIEYVLDPGLEGILIKECFVRYENCAQLFHPWGTTITFPHLLHTLT